MKKHLKEISFFVGGFLVLSALLHTDALIGKTLLAPLDFGPDVLEHFGYMDESADGIPDNHYISDQFVYDLPLQKVIWESYQAGEIPWWDPYSYGGRPLLADAHINGTDPIRILCDLILPFELAYNWNIIIRDLFIGLGMFLLLRKTGVRFSLATVFGMIYPFSGWFFLFFGHPWIAGSFLYYPYLWLVWSHLSGPNPRLAIAMGGLLCGGVFMAGNLQSHVYLPTFACLFLIGQWLHRRSLLFRQIGVIAACGFLGALLASVVLWNQVEFFLNSQRAVVSSGWSVKSLSNIFFLGSSIFPWATGSFRTLSITTIGGGSSTAYVLFAGGVVTLLAFFRFVGRDRGGEPSTRFREATCVAKVALIWLVLMSVSPLLDYYYFRSGAIGGMALIVLAAISAEKLCRGQWEISTRMLKAFAVVFGLGLVALQVAALVVYPRMKDTVTEMVGKSLSGKTNQFKMPELREFQIDQFAREVSFLNYETLIAAISIGAFVWLVWRRQGEPVRVGFLVLLLVISSIPLFSFYVRFRPKHEIVLWERLQTGGEAVRQVKEAATGFKRFDEENSTNSMVLPFAFPAFYEVNAVRGYSALQPRTIVNQREEVDIPLSWQMDVVKAGRSGEDGLDLRQVSDGARFRLLASGEAAEVEVTRQSLNTLTLSSHEDDGTEVIRTDTRYPGWSRTGGGEWRSVAPSFSAWTLGSGENSFQYQPTSIAFAPYLSGLAFLCCGFLGLSGGQRKSRET